VEENDPEDDQKFQSTTNMFPKVLMKCLELVGAVEDATREVVVVLMMRLSSND